MKLKLTFLFSLLLCFASAQQPDLKTAPINPNPLEDLKYIIPRDINEKVAYFMGRFYNEKGQRLDPSGVPYTAYATEDVELAKKLYKTHDIYDSRGNLTQNTRFDGNYIFTTKYEYDSKNNLTKKTNSGTIYEYGYDNQNRLNKYKVTNSSNNESLTENISYEYQGDITIVTKTTLDATGNDSKSVHTYKNGIIMIDDYGPTLRTEFNYVFDNKDNWTERNYASGGNRDRRSIIYFDDLSLSLIKVRETQNSIGDAKPVLTANGKTLTVNQHKVGANYLAYLPMTNTYYFAENYYSKKHAAGTEFSVVEVPMTSDLAAINNRILLKGQPSPDLLKVASPDFNLFYDPNGHRYFQIIDNPLNLYGFGKIIEFKTDFLGYNNISGQRGYFFNKGKKEFLIGVSANELENGNILINISGKPTYVLKPSDTTSDMLIYMVSEYKNEKIKQE